MASAATYYPQGRHGKFEPGKAQYSTQIFFDRLFLIRVYWNQKSRQDRGFGVLPAVAALAQMHIVLFSDKLLWEKTTV